MDLHGVYLLISGQYLLFLYLCEAEGISREHFISESGNFQSPNHPLSYGANEQYTWNITAPEGFEITLTFASFQVEYNRLCEYDRVEVLDGTDGSTLGVFCGNLLPHIIRSPKNKMIVKFVSDASVQLPGFSASFKIEARSCATPDRTWLLYEDHCYKIYPSKKLTWHNAKTLCQENGAHLVSINSAEEGNFLQELLKIAFEKFSNESNYWIGMRANDLNSSYEWTDDSSVVFKNWNSDDKTNDSVSCVSMDKLTGLWIKTNCSISLSVMCEIKEDNNLVLSTTTSSAPRVTGFCPDGWFTFGSKCYKVFGKKIKERQTWSKAQEKCAEINSTLASIHSKEEQEFLTLNVLSSIPFVWIGMRFISGSFKWLDGSDVDFTYWGNNQPNRMHGKEEECVLFLMKQSDLGSWHDYPCSDKYAYICETLKDPTLTRIGQNAAICTDPENWMSLDAYCYKSFNEEDKLLNWQQAQRYCMKFGGSLATIRNFAVSKFLSQNLTGYDELFWIGMKKMSDDEYGWIGSPSLNYYSNWIGGKPADVPNESKCVAMNRREEWTLQDCRESHAFMCEVRKGNVSTDIIDDGLVCPTSSRKWKDLGTKSCYIVDWESQETWYAAQYHCRSEGGDLAIFSTSEELDSIEAFLRGIEKEVHIGLRKKLNVFEWIDGSTIDYNIWGYQKSNFARKRCGQIWTEDLYLYDYDCSKPSGFICSTPKISEFQDTAPPTFTEKVSSSTVSKLTSTLSSEAEEKVEQTDAPRKIIGYAIPVYVVSGIVLLLLIGLSVSFLRKWYRRKCSHPDVHVRLTEITDS